MANLKSSRLAIASVAVFLALACVQLEGQAQKTIKNSFQQSISSGSALQSVYGGYDRQSSQSIQSSLVSPVQRRVQQQQTYVNRQRTESQAQPTYQQQEQQYSSSGSSSSSSYDQQAEADAEPAQYGAVAGQPGRDFPGYTRVPKTSFSCDGLPYDYGMYADEETGCQAYHVCYNGRKESFLCGVGTVFNQRILHCDYWYSVDCGKSSQYYSSNAYMGSSQPEPGPAEASSGPVAQRPVSQSNYRRTEIASSSNTINRPLASPRQRFQQSANSFSKNTQQVQEAY